MQGGLLNPPFCRKRMKKGIKNAKTANPFIDLSLYT